MKTYRLCPCCHRLHRASALRPIRGARRVVTYPDCEPFLLGTCPTEMPDGLRCGNSPTVPVRMLDQAEAAECGLDVTATGEVMAA